jgi:hypothetical protein
MPSAVSLLGDAGGWLLSALYSYRLLVGAIGVAVLVAGVLLARRHGWLGWAHRHPRAVAFTSLPALIVGLPVAWYLFSPLLVRTTLDEPPPSVAIASPALAAATGVPTARPTSPSPAGSMPAGEPDATVSPAITPAPVPTSWVAAVARSGTFQGTDEFHYGRGTARLTETAPGDWTLRLERFSVRNGPDLYVYLSPDPAGYGPGAIELERLRATDGSFNVRIPSGTDVAAHQSVLIWCKQFSHLFAYASLRP